MRNGEITVNPKLNEDLTAEEYWKVVFKERSLDELAQPNLVKVVKVLLSLPYSNVAVERVFNQQSNQLKLFKKKIIELISSKRVYLLC